MAEAVRPLTPAPTLPRTSSRLLRFAPTVTLALFLVPVGAGLIDTALPSLGFMPALGGGRFSLQPWRDLFAYPGFADSLRLTVGIGVAATLLSLFLAIALCAALAGRRFVRLQQVLTPVLAAPHAAMAIGLAFLVAPSGWLVRLVSPWLTGWDLPPAIVTVHDPLGLAAIAGLVLKETPYLVLMIAAALNQVPAPRLLMSARSMGYGRLGAWIKVVLPQVYPQIRLPVFAVLAFSLSSVEIGLVLAPGTPPPLAVLAARWFADYDLHQYFPASAAAILQLFVVAAVIALWFAGERLAAMVGRRWLACGHREGVETAALRAGTWLAAVPVALSLLALGVLLLWSLAADWRYPDALPDWSLATWSGQAAQLRLPAATTLLVGLAVSLVAAMLALACLENEQRNRSLPGAGILWIVYLPLLLPQIGFLFGVQTVLVRAGIDGTIGAVVWAHLLFVFPYVFLSLADPWRALDPRFMRIAAALGVSPRAAFWRVKLPMLLRPLLVALAVGFAVSVGQYLPTLFAGAGRIATLTTDAVTLSSGGDRRIVGLYALLSAALPFAFYGLAIAVPALLYRHRRGLQ